MTPPASTYRPEDEDDDGNIDYQEDGTSSETSGPATHSGSSQSEQMVRIEGTEPSQTEPSQPSESQPVTSFSSSKMEKVSIQQESNKNPKKSEERDKVNGK